MAVDSDETVLHFHQPLDSDSDDSDSESEVDDDVDCCLKVESVSVGVEDSDVVDVEVVDSVADWMELVRRRRMMAYSDYETSFVAGGRCLERCLSVCLCVSDNSLSSDCN